jgi:hypothetical protein
MLYSIQPIQGGQLAFPDPPILRAQDRASPTILREFFFWSSVVEIPPDLTVENTPALPQTDVDKGRVWGLIRCWCKVGNLEA